MLSSKVPAKDQDMNGNKGGPSGPGSKGILSHVRIEHLIAGVSGGVTSTLILHPLDLIKVRFAVNDGRTNVPQYNGLRNAMATIFRQEGVRGLYRGVAPNMWGSGSAWGLYFLFYNTIKTWIQGGNPEYQLGWALHMAAAAKAGVLTLIITNPLWVVKTRLCLQYGADGSLPPSKQYSGMMDAFSKIYRLEGVRGLYKGFVPGMFGVSHGAIQFMAYEEMKSRYNEYRGAAFSAHMSTVESLCFAAASKLVAASVTYPYQVVRARLQDHHHNYAGTWDCVTQTWRFEGHRGFYKGMGVSLIRVVPATMITMTVHDQMSYFMLNRGSKA